MSEPKPVHYWLCTLAATISLKPLVNTAMGRWRIGRDYQELKSELGQHHYGGRNWRGFHPHVTPCITAYGFLMCERLRSKKTPLDSKRLPYPEVSARAALAPMQRHVPQSIDPGGQSGSAHHKTAAAVQKCVGHVELRNTVELEKQFGKVPAVKPHLSIARMAALKSTDGRRLGVLEASVCAAIVALGVLDMAGWLLRVPAIVSIRLGMRPMVFNTGLCFCVVGVAFWQLHREDNISRTIRTVLATLVTLLCTAILTEFISGRSLGIDFASMHVWYDSRNIHPGRMAPITALNFIVICAAVILADRVTTKREAVTCVVLTFFVLGMGLIGLAGYALAPDVLFEWARAERMSIPTATGMILCSVALRFSWSKSPWYVAQQYFREDKKIVLLGAATLIVVTVTAGITGFVLQQNVLEDVLTSRLESARQERIAFLNAAIEQVTPGALHKHLQRLEAASIAVLIAPGPSESDERVIEAEAAANKLHGVLIAGSSAERIRTFGNVKSRPPIIAPLISDDVQLLWDDGLVLRTRMPLMHLGQRIGSLMLDYAMPSLDLAMFDVSHLGTTAELAICRLSSATIVCFPGRKHAQPFVVSPTGESGDSLPMRRALSGEFGRVITVDYLGHDVLAVYGLLAPGLGIVVKEDTFELYAPIRSALRLGIPLLSVIAFLGAVLLYLQFRPLAAQMLAAEARATEKEHLVRAVVGAVDEGILTIDEGGSILDVNRSACDTFGYDSSELIGKHSIMLTLEEGRIAEYGRLNCKRGHGLADLSGQRNVKLSGRKKDGSEFPLEVTITALGLAGKSLFVGAVRDVTERTEEERKLTALGLYDSLTALPNRSLFLKKLSLAPSHMRASGKAFGVIFIDVDGFKQVNDTYGHRSGDDLLIQLAQRLSAAVRDLDTVARLSGDEFTIILEGLVEPVDDATRIAEKIIVSLNKPFLLSGREVRVSASMGVALHRQGECNTAELLGRADKAMYSAKQSGKNRIAVDGGAMDKL